MIVLVLALSAVHIPLINVKMPKCLLSMKKKLYNLLGGPQIITLRICSAEIVNFDRI